jgi:hypothetical protein
MRKAPRLHAELLAGRQMGSEGLLGLPRSRQSPNSAAAAKFPIPPRHGQPNDLADLVLPNTDVKAIILDDVRCRSKWR